MIAIMIQIGLSVKTSNINPATMHGYCCSNGVYNSGCIIFLAFEVSKKDVSDIDCTVMTFITSGIWSFAAVSTINTKQSVTLAFLSITWILTYASCTISIVTVRQWILLIII